MELRAYNSLISEITELNAKVVAISSALPDVSLSLAEKEALKFTVLSDIDNKVAKQFGVSIALDESLIGLYKNFGIDLEKAHGNTNYELPIPATFLIGKDGTVLLADVDVDYTKRAEPQLLLDEIRKNS